MKGEGKASLVFALAWKEMSGLLYSQPFFPGERVPDTP
jgi:hypothetical protein